jgi:hypothetical protein
MAVLLTDTDTLFGGGLGGDFGNAAVATASAAARWTSVAPVGDRRISTMTLYSQQFAHHVINAYQGSPTHCQTYVCFFLAAFGAIWLV